MEPIKVRQELAALRALIVSYNFPPVGGAGVQRAVKLAKYLPYWHVVPSVLTVQNPSVPLSDTTLLGDLPAQINIIRARTWEPGYAVKRAAWRPRGRASVFSVERQIINLGKQLMLPDPQVLWQPAARRALLRQLRAAEAPEVVLISGPPFSQFLMGPAARRAGAAVVLDYRDEWTTWRNSYEMTARLSAWAGERLEEKLLKSAHLITTATEAFRRELLRRFDFLDPERVHPIPNGYDPDDFPVETLEPPTNRFVLTYAGTVFRLTSARGLLAALRLLHAREPELAKRLEVRFIGRVVETEASAFEGSEALGVHRISYLPHRRVLEELAQSHLVCCILDDVPGSERIYPGKIFELMYLRRPTLTLAPEGALTELVRRHNLGEVAPPRAITTICDTLANKLRQFVSGQYVAHSDPVDIACYHRRAIAEQFARAFRHAAAIARGA